MSFTTRNVAETQGTTQPPNPKVGDQHFDTATGITYRCSATDTWSAMGLPPAYGALFENGAGTVINMATGGTYYPWVSSTVGVSNNTTVSAASDDITIGAAGAGVYQIGFSVSFSGTTNTTFHWAIFVDAAKQAELDLERKIGTSSDIGVVASMGLLTLSAGEVVSLRTSASANTKTVTVNHVSITLERVG